MTRQTDNRSVQAKVFVITGPSGVGKGTLIERLLACRPEIELSVSATTRRPRHGEMNGRDYTFLSPESFHSKVESGQFLEHATYIGNQYGTLISEIDRRLNAGKSVVLEIEIQGARQIRKAMPEAVQIFIKPPSLDELKKRLLERHTDTPEQIEARLETAVKELKSEPQFDNVVVNDDLDLAVEQLKRIVDENLQ